MFRLHDINNAIHGQVIGGEQCPVKIDMNLPLQSAPDHDVCDPIDLFKVPFDVVISPVT